MRLSIKKKLLLIASLPFCVTIGALIVSIETMVSQNNLLTETFTTMDVEQREATATVISILHYQSSLNALIAAEDSNAIRANSIKAIKSTAELDEQIQKLKTVMPQSEELNLIENMVARLHPIKMQVIKSAKKNQDIDAMKFMTRIEQDCEVILHAAQTILENELARLDELTKSNESSTKKSLWIMLSCVAVGFIFVMAITLIFSKGIINSILNMQSVIGAFAKGQLQSCEPSGSKDEIDSTIVALNGAISSTRQIVGRIREQSDSLKENAQYISSGSKKSSEGMVLMDQRVQNINENAKRLLEIAESVKAEIEQCRSNASTTSECCDSASQIIDKSTEIQTAFKREVEELSGEIDALSESARSINSIAATISSVSEQTNLLALNAAIEAARAGDHGRGFAVVAEEVRALAMRSSEAVENISNLAATMADSVGSVTQKLNHVQVQFDENQTMFGNCNVQIGRANANSSELLKALECVVGRILDQQQSIQEIYQHVDELSSISNSATCNASGLNQMSENLNKSSLQLEDMVAHFKLEER